MSNPVIKQARVGLLCAAAVVSVGCTMAPRYERPAAPVPNEWDTSVVAPAVNAAEGETIASLPWRQFIVSEKLRGLVELALQNNRDLRVAALNVERARAQYRIQRSELVPSVSANGQMIRQRVPGELAGLPDSVITEQYSAALGAAFELDLFGRVRSLNRAALETYLAQESSRRSVHISLISEVANLFLITANDLALKELAEATAKAQAEWFALTQQRHKLGAASGLELSQAETQVETARADVARYEGNVAQDFNALRLLVGTGIPDELRPTSADAQHSLVAAVPVGMPSEVLLQRPDILAAEHTLRAANANIGAARAAFFPTISLTGSAGYASTELSGLFDSPNKAWSFTPQVSLPIFQGGRVIAGLQTANVDRDIALARYEQAIQIGFQEVNDALALTGSLTRQREALERYANATARAYELSQQRRKAGQDSYLILLDAQRTHYAAQQALISSRLAEQANIVSLYRALGGGWEADAS